jgi:hypothetical protein
LDREERFGMTISKCDAATAELRSMGFDRAGGGGDEHGGFSVWGHRDYGFVVVRNGGLMRLKQDDLSPNSAAVTLAELREHCARIDAAWSRFVEFADLEVTE